MKKHIHITSPVFITALLLLLATGSGSAQTSLLRIIGGSSTPAYIILNNPSAVNSLATPIYLVVNWNDTRAIFRDNSSNAGWIKSEADGNFVKWNTGTGSGAFVIPFGAGFGSATSTYIPFTFNKSATANITTSTRGGGSAVDSDNLPWPSDVDNMNVPWGNAKTSVIDRFWRLDVTSNINATLTFSYRGGENTCTDYIPPVSSHSKFGAQQWDLSNGHPGEWLPTLGNEDGFNTVGSVFSVSTGSSIIPFTKGDPWVLSLIDEPLPIEFLFFNSQCDQGNVDINWATASESNNNFFTVQRSLNTIDYEDVVVVPGAGNSNSVLYYHATDYHPFNNVSFYRLKQTDFNGNFTYSNVVMAPNCIQLDPQANFSVFADPANNNMLTVLFDVENPGPFTVYVYDIMGRLITKKSESLLNKTSLDLHYCAFGIYLVTVQTNTQTTTRKIFYGRE